MHSRLLLSWQRSHSRVSLSSWQLLSPWRQSINPMSTQFHLPFRWDVCTQTVSSWCVLSFGIFRAATLSSCLLLPYKHHRFRSRHSVIELCVFQFRSRVLSASSVQSAQHRQSCVLVVSFVQPSLLHHNLVSPAHTLGLMARLFVQSAPLVNGLL